jgi:hypothetical protein
MRVDLKAHLRQGVSAPVVLVGIGLAMVAFFDLQTNLPLLDEYARRWTIQRIVDGHGVQLWGFSPNLVQTAVALPAALVHLEPRFWRLAGLPFLVAEGVFLYLATRDLGARPWWSALAAAAAVCSPLSLSVSTGMMTETGFLGLYAAALWAGLRWIGNRGTGWIFTAVVAAAVLQRQQAVVLPMVIVAVLVLNRRGRPLTRGDVAAGGASLLAALAAFALTYALHARSPRTFSDSTPHFGGAFFALYAITSSVTLLGLFALPFLLGLIRRAPADSRPSWAGAVSVPLAIAGLLVPALTILPGRHNLFPGDHVTPTGLGVFTVGGKLGLLPWIVYGAIEALAAVSALVVLVWRRRDWGWSRLGPTGQFLVFCAAANLPFIYLEGLILDRYYLLVAVPILPLLALWASSVAAEDRPSQAWGLACIAGFLFYAAVGIQDYIAWQVARDQAAGIAYRQAAPWQVDAGFEENAEHVWIPAVDQPGSGRPSAVDGSPELTLLTVGSGDPRPGASYSSLASGRVVVVRHRPSASP